MKKISHWVFDHQVIAFFLIAFMITWGLGFTWDAVMNKGMDLLLPLAFLATSGPALSGIIISAFINPQAVQGTKRRSWVAFLAALIVSALVFIAHNTVHNYAPFHPVAVIFIVVSVAPVAFVISMAFGRNPAVKNYLASLVRLRDVWGWCLLAMILMPTLVLLSVRVSNLLGRQPLTVHRFSETGLVLAGLIVTKFLYQFFFFNATGEEAGWRGFALPRMQSLTSPLVACLVMNLFWILWHLFLWTAEGRPVFTLPFWVQQYLECLPATVTISWFFNRSKGSILVAGITHAAANTTFAFFPNLDWTAFVWTSAGAALVLIVADRMWKKLPSDHPAVYTKPELLQGQKSPSMTGTNRVVVG